MSRSCEENSRRSKHGARDMNMPFATRERNRRPILTSPLNCAATLPAGDLTGLKFGLNLGLNLNEERFIERTRVAQEFQATLIQGFLAAFMQVHATDRALDRGQSEVPALQVASLGESFAGVPNDVGFPSTVGFRVVVSGRKRELTAGLQDELYRIGREAIVNAFRHSGAHEIEAEIEYRSTELRIHVRDNGCGINSQELQWSRNGYRGLQGMRERAERIGARLRLMSKVALGTEVELCIPGRIAFAESGVRASH